MTYSPGLFSKLANKEVITPYVERAFLDDDWPEGGYNLHVDTSPHGAGTDGFFHPSTHAMPTDERWLQFQIDPRYSPLMVRPRNSLGLEMAGAVGSAIHAVIQQKLKGVGLVTDEEIETDAIDIARHWRGKIDLMFQGKLVDIKTVTQYGFDYTSKVPREEWVYQINPYMDFMGTDRAIILVVEIGWPYRMKELTLFKDEELTWKIYDKWQRVWDRVQAGEEPPPCECPLGTKKQESCEGRYVCWGR